MTKSVVQAKALGLQNFSVLVSHVRVPPAMHAVLGSPHNRVQGFLSAGHVNAVMAMNAEDARQTANQLDTAASRGEWAGLLHGMTLAIKDNIDTQEVDLHNIASVQFDFLSIRTGEVEIDSIAFTA